MKAVEFKNYRNNIVLAGNLFCPDDFSEDKKYPAIVVTHPGGGVKEQTAGTYAERLSKFGFVTLAFDASHQGESGGDPHFVDDPFARVEDISVAADYMLNLPFVDEDKLGLLGICAGGGHAVNAACGDHRYRAVATVSAMDVGAAFRAGLTPETVDELLLASAKERTKEARGEQGAYMTYIPDTKEAAEATGSVMLQEAFDYYMTERGCYKTAQNKLTLSSAMNLYRYSAYEPVGLLLTQPLLMIAGSIAETKVFSEQGVALSNGPKELYLVEGATHVSLYDKEEHLVQALDKLNDFYRTNLAV